MKIQLENGEFLTIRVSERPYKEIISNGVIYKIDPQTDMVYSNNREYRLNVGVRNSRNEEVFNSNFDGFTFSLLDSAGFKGLALFDNPIILEQLAKKFRKFEYIPDDNGQDVFFYAFPNGGGEEIEFSSAKEFLMYLIKQAEISDEMGN